jgi:hypothetical protein
MEAHSVLCVTFNQERSTHRDEFACVYVVPVPINVYVRTREHVGMSMCTSTYAQVSTYAYEYMLYVIYVNLYACISAILHTHKHAVARLHVYVTIYLQAIMCVVLPMVSRSLVPTLSSTYGLAVAEEHTLLHRVNIATGVNAELGSGVCMVQMLHRSHLFVIVGAGDNLSFPKNKVTVCMQPCFHVETKKHTSMRTDLNMYRLEYVQTNRRTHTDIHVLAKIRTRILACIYHTF